ncbi:MAG: dihydroorotate dehydrogenase [Patescibacteria group bacterium]|jgi:dihydroorotate dehydrogenase (NAD+) catalytic subunit
MNSRKVDLSTTLAGVLLGNPVMNASGTWDEEGEQLLEDPKPGAIVSKTVKLKPVPGNPTPRLYDTNRGVILNAIGLAGDGIEDFLARKLLPIKALGRRVVVNISGTTVEEYVELTARLDGSGIDMIEANISCPNVKMGMSFGQDPKLTYELVSAIRSRAKVPLIAKLTPNVTDIVAIAKAAQAGGADVLSLINTLLGMDINPETGQPVLANITGGVSGPGILRVALRCVWQVCHCPDIRIPVIGMGGITEAADAMKFFWAGAQAVAVGTANFGHPASAMPRIILGISEWLERHGFSSFEEWRRSKETRQQQQH